MSNSDLAGRERPGSPAGDFDWNELDAVLGKAASALRWAEFDDVLSDVTATLKSAERETDDEMSEGRGSAGATDDARVLATSDIRVAASAAANGLEAPEPFENGAPTEHELSPSGRDAVANWQSAALDEFYGSTLANGSPSMLQKGLQPAAMTAVALLLAGVFWAGWSMQSTERPSRWQEAKNQVMNEAEYAEALGAKDGAKTPTVVKAAVEANVMVEPPVVRRQSLILPSSLLGPESVLHAAPLGLSAPEPGNAPTKIDARPDRNQDKSASAGIAAEKRLARSATETEQR